MKLKAFLTPHVSAYAVWNKRRKVDAEILAASVSDFLPHTWFGVVPEEVLDGFCKDRATTFLLSPRLMQHFERVSLAEEAERTVQCLNLCQLKTIDGRGHSNQRKTAKSCPIV